ncbi:DDE-type integrase/transposase/recombinase [Microbispora bryophytorum]|nr:DDE-type integrase/transposase/recombinase [Microbispora bryophytorum]
MSSARWASALPTGPGGPSRAGRTGCRPPTTAPTGSPTWGSRGRGFKFRRPDTAVAGQRPDHSPSDQALLMSDRRLTVKLNVPTAPDQCPSIPELTRGSTVNEGARGRHVQMNFLVIAGSCPVMVGFDAANLRCKGRHAPELIRNKGPWRDIDDVEIAVASTSTGTTTAGCTGSWASSRPSSTRATVEDLFSRRMLGFAMSAHHDAALTIAALQMAAVTRGGGVDGVIFYSDRGSEYTAARFAAACRHWGVVQSMGRVGCALDNAAAESFNSTLKVELVHRHCFATRAEGA